MHTISKALLFLFLSILSFSGFAAIITYPEEGSTVTGDSLTFTWEHNNLDDPILNQVISYGGTTLTLDPAARSATFSLEHRATEYVTRMQLSIETEDSQRHGAVSRLIRAFHVAAETLTGNLPSFDFLAGSMLVDNTGPEAREVQGWISRVFDDEGNAVAIGSNPRIHFLLTRNTNPSLFAEQPWIDYLTRSLHFSIRSDNTVGEAEICMKASQVQPDSDPVSSEPKCFTLAILDHQPSFDFLAPSMGVDNTGTQSRQVLGWISQAFDGEGGVQNPNGVDNTASTPIYFETVSNSNPGLFAEQPWISYPSHALHFSTSSENAIGEAEICVKAVQENTGLSSEPKCFTLAVEANPETADEHPPTFEILDITPGGLSGVSKTVSSWVSQASDGEGGFQYPNDKGTSNTLIYFEIVSNSNPSIFTEKPWVSYPSHALHFKGGSVSAVEESEICVRAVEENSGLASGEQCFTVKVLPVSTHNQNNCHSSVSSCLQITSPERGSLLKGDEVTFTWGAINVLDGIVEQTLSFNGTVLTLDPNVRSKTISLTHADEETSLSRLVISYVTEEGVAVENLDSTAVYHISAKTDTATSSTPSSSTETSASGGGGSIDLLILSLLMGLGLFRRRLKQKS